MTSEDISRIIYEKLEQNGEQQEYDFVFGKFKDKPNAQGVFKIKDRWFVYETDERNIKSITGPFNDEDIVFVCAKMMHKSRYFEEYRFSNDAKSTYIHVHYRSLKEAEESF